jgi:hypothetical protein
MKAKDLIGKKIMKKEELKDTIYGAIFLCSLAAMYYYTILIFG